MLLIDNVLVRDEVFTEHFACNLDICKGACCWEGEYGAPVTTAEIFKMEDALGKISGYLPAEKIKEIKRVGVAIYDKDFKEYLTPLMPDESCVFLTKNKEGISLCAFEMAYNDGVTNFKKPISCHLYPIRIVKQKKSPFETMEYREWDICSSACELGKQKKLPVYKYLKEAIIRKYGTDFYEELNAAGKHLKHL